MTATAIDSVLLGNLFSAPAMRAVFADETRLQHCLDIEAALARVEARRGLIPAAAAEEIARQAVAANFDLAALRERTATVGAPIAPVVDQLVARCAADFGQYCHWGATTQDIADTATALQMRDGFALIADDLGAIAASLADLARRYRNTPMAGRTNLQQAAPISFGFKVVGWLDAVERHRARLAEIRSRVLVGQFGGAVGTFAALGERGPEVAEALMAELGLNAAEIAWHSHRDRIAETGCWLAMAAGTLAKIATDVKLLMQTEVAEVFEPYAPGRGSSSTMPQKRNPVACDFVAACAALARHQAAALIEAMVADHERPSGAWQIEWAALPEIFLLASGALAHTRTMVAGLVVDPARMRANLAANGGLIMAEAAMMSLAPYLGRENAHRLVTARCRQALDERRTLLDVLAADAEIARYFDRAALERLLDPANYLGAAPAIVDRILARLARS